jgi:hypothetical protein
MLNDQEIERAAAQLADYKRSDALSHLLEQYAVLIDDYKRLKSDYEEERESREKYKQMAKDQERNPFVLVLVDGDGYVFNDTLLAKRPDGPNGGSAAAQMLNDEVKVSLRRKGLEHCQVMVRVYANVFGLSKVLSKNGVVGADSRSLSPFIASFNRSYGLTEFIDAGQLKENADFKLRALLRLYSDNSQCKHIYFAACHDVGYISELTPFTGNSSKFTLVNTPGVRFHDEFTKLGMGIEEFRSVFRHTPLDGAGHYRPISSGLVAVASAISKPIPGSSQPQPPSPVKPQPTPASTANNDQKTVCFFHSIGKCRYGKSCKLLHVNPAREPKASQQYADPPSPSGLPVTGNGTTLPSAFADMPDLSAKLPKKHEMPGGHIAVNFNNYRLDPSLPPISSDIMNRLKARIDKRRVCNGYHLQDSCDLGDQCEYDHEPLDEEFLPALELLARTQPCPRRGNCRLEGCNHGHICQTIGCKHRGGKVYCKLPFLCHEEEHIVARYVPSVSKQRKVANGTSDTNGGSGSSTTSG